MERVPQGWSRELKNGVYVLTRTFKFDDFTQVTGVRSRVLAKRRMQQTTIRKLR